MSKIIISCFLVVLLCSSCHARNFQKLQKDADQIPQHAMTTKNSERMANVSGRVSTRSETESSLANGTIDAKVHDGMSEEKKTTLDKTASSDKPGKHTEAKGGDMATPRKKPLAQVSWKVPHEKTDDKEPGFNLDYLPPKTHSPVHN